jgi:hypothetical protein
MANRLLDRQASLLGYLTSGDAIFGGPFDAPVDPALRGIDLGMLRLEARFSHEKRMKKIAAVFPRTFEILNDDLDAVVREFARACPPTEISRIVNARQFHDFMFSRWERVAPCPPHLPDVATFELACAHARAAADQVEQGTGVIGGAPGRIRRHPGVVLVRCDYDIRSIFEGGPREAAPENRVTLLAIVMPAGADQPRVSQLTPTVFELLDALDAWIDPTVLGVSSAEVEELVRELGDHGLVEAGT